MAQLSPRAVLSAGPETYRWLGSWRWGFHWSRCLCSAAVRAGKAFRSWLRDTWAVGAFWRTKHSAFLLLAGAALIRIQSLLRSLLLTAATRRRASRLGFILRLTSSFLPGSAPAWSRAPRFVTHISFRVQSVALYIPGTGARAAASLPASWWSSGGPLALVWTTRRTHLTIFQSFMLQNLAPYTRFL